MTDSSSVNFAPPLPRANASAMARGAGGGVTFRSNTDVDVITDMTGAFAPAGLGLRTTAPTRVVDTRGGAPVAANTRFAVTLNAPADARGVVANVAVIPRGAPGFVQAFACDAGPPPTSNINHGPTAVVNNAVISTITGGQLCFQSLAEVDLIVDVNGYLVDNGELSLQLINPLRVMDTRNAGSIYSGAPRRRADRRDPHRCDPWSARGRARRARQRHVHQRERQRVRHRVSLRNRHAQRVEPQLRSQLGQRLGRRLGARHRAALPLLQRAHALDRRPARRVGSHAGNVADRPDAAPARSARRPRHDRARRRLVERRERADARRQRPRWATRDHRVETPLRTAKSKDRPRASAAAAARNPRTRSTARSPSQRSRSRRSPASASADPAHSNATSSSSRSARSALLVPDPSPNRLDKRRSGESFHSAPLR
jgi:hypothetical protein